MAAFGAKYMKWAVITKEEDGKLPTYGEAKTLGALVKADLTVNFASGELYADDKLQEKLDEFVSGSLAAEVDELDDEIAGAIYGATVNEEGEKIDNTADNVPYGGLAYYKTLMKNGKKFYRAYFYPKTKAALGNDNAATKANGITFATAPVSFTVYEPNTGDWRYTFRADEEKDVVDWIDKKLSGTAAAG